MKPLDPEDPMALVGVTLERDPDDEALTEMATCFVEEYARMGWSGARIMRLFHNRFFRGPNLVLQLKGEDFVRGLIDAVEVMRRQLQTPAGVEDGKTEPS